MAKKKGVVNFTLVVEFEYDDEQMSLHEAGEEVVDRYRCSRVKKEDGEHGLRVCNEVLGDFPFTDECE